MMEAPDSESQFMMRGTIMREGSPTSVIALSAILSCESSESSQGSMDHSCSKARVRDQLQSAPMEDRQIFATQLPPADTFPHINGSSSVPSCIDLNSVLPVEEVDTHLNLPSGTGEIPQELMHEDRVRIDLLAAASELLTFCQRSDCETSSPNNMFMEWRNKRAQIDPSHHPNYSKEATGTVCIGQQEQQIPAVNEGRRKETQGERDAMTGNASFEKSQGGAGNLEKFKIWKAGSCSSAAYAVGQMQRRPHPSKWDDAEKWLMNSSTEQSPAHPQSRITNPRPSALLAVADHSRPKKSSTLALKLRRLARPANATIIEQHPKAAPSKRSNTFSHSHKPHLLDTANSDSQNQTVDSLNSRRMKNGQTSKSAVVGTSLDSRSSSLALQTEGATVGTDLIVRCQKFSTASAMEMNFSGDLSSTVRIKDKHADAIKTTVRHGCPESTSISRQTDRDPLSQEFKKIRVKMREVSSCVSSSINSMRDMSTQITPFSSAQPSRSTTPVKESPARHNTPARQTLALVDSATLDFLQPQNLISSAKLVEHGHPHVQLADADCLERSASNAWSSKEEEEAESSKSLCLTDMTGARKANILQGRATAWEEAQQAKYIARYKQKELKIQAWESQQIAKVEAQLWNLEVKLEKMRLHANDKLMNKLANAQHRAKDKLAIAQSRQKEQISRIKERAQYMRNNGRTSTCFNLSK